MIDSSVRNQARRSREIVTAATEPELDRRAGPTTTPDTDDTLILLFLCCHPALTPASQTALTLRAVGGLTTAEIARAFLVPEGTMAARISRAKQTIKAGRQPLHPARAGRAGGTAARASCTRST